MERHHISGPWEFAKMMKEKGADRPLGHVQIDRILKGAMQTEPELDSLRRMAEFLGESLSRAFPEPEDEDALVVEVAGRKFRLRAEDDLPVSPTLEAEVQKALAKVDVAGAHEVHKAKQEHRRKKAP